MRFWLILILISPVAAVAQTREGVSLEQMRRDLVKLEKSIEETKDKIKNVKDAGFLPDLYFALGEFLVERSRYLYAIKIAENPTTPAEELDFTGEKRPKLEAVQAYETIIEKFPKLPERDRAIFFKAHELREMGRLEDMLRAYIQLTNEYPNSEYWTESQIIIGDYFFEEKKDMDLALEVYQKILKRPPGMFTPLANYKIGWVYVNKSKFRDALLSYEKVLTQNRDVDLSKLPEIYKKTDVRREALLALVWPYSEVPVNELARMGNNRHDVMSYFKGLAPDKVSYEKVLSRLGRRLVIKQRFVDATKVYFEYFRLAGDIKDRVDVVERLYVSMKNSRRDWPVRGLVKEIAKTVALAENAEELKAKERKKALHDMEIFARDVATRQNKRAKKTRAKEDWEWTIRDYNLYLAIFPASKYARALRLNLAESYFNAGRPVEAGREYEWLAKNTKKPKRAKSYFDSSIQSYISAIRQQTTLSKLLLTEARYGLREAGRGYMAKYPKDPINDDILFNIGQTFYDERRFPQAVATFKDYIAKYPGGAKTSIAANLILDAHNQREDFKAIVSDGKAIIANPKITDSALKNQVKDIVQQAEMKAVQVAAGDFTAPDYASNLLKLARKYEGSSMGDQALYEAFTALRAKKDPKAYDSGEQLLMQHRASKYALEVATSMGQMALTTADFRRAALYFELFAERYPAKPEAKELLKNAVKMRELMGEFKIAARTFKKLGDNAGAARMDYLSGDWSGLLRSAPGAGGLQSSYYEGLALYRLRGIGPARTALERTAQSGGGSFEEQEMAAHALYLLSMAAMENYKAVQMREGGEAKAVSEKAAMLKALEAQLNRVIQFGNGRWSIAALYGLGQAKSEFAKFIRRAPMPKGLNPGQQAQYKQILDKQAAEYSQSAAQYFRQCVNTAEKFEVLTRFVIGCLSSGKILVDESKEVEVLARAAEVAPSGAAEIRRELFDKPRSVPLLIKLAQVHVKANDYSMAELILNRALEIEPENAAVMANIGSTNLYKRDYTKAKVWFEKALKKNSRQALARWGIAGLFKKFRFPTKRQSALSAAQEAGKPTGILHPLVGAREEEPLESF